MRSSSLLILGIVCIGHANAVKMNMAVKPADIIERFRNVLPGAFPKGMSKYVDAAQDLGQDVFHDVTGTTFGSKEELDDAKRLMKFLASMSLVQQKVDEFEVDPENPDEMKKATDEQLNGVEQRVEEAADQMMKAGILKIQKPSLDGQPETEESQRQKQEERGGMTEEEFEKAKKEIADSRKTFNEDEESPTKEVPEHVREARRMRAQARRWRRSYKPQMKTSVMFDYGEEMVREIFREYDTNKNGMLEINEFNSLQTDTEGEGAVHTKEQFVNLVKEADPGTRGGEGIRFKVFHDLYLEPDVSAKFETVLPADYQRLYDSKKIKGEAVPGIKPTNGKKAEIEKEAEPEVKPIDA